jgi:hypothetical protein
MRFAGKLFSNLELAYKKWATKFPKVLLIGLIRSKTHSAVRGKQKPVTLCRYGFLFIRWRGFGLQVE